MNTKKLRPGQQAALDVILGRIADRQSRTAIVLPTRYGKSDVIRLAAISAAREGTSLSSIALSPSEFLRNQLVRADKIEAMALRYGLGSEARLMRIMGSAFEYRPFSNGELLLSATIQLATRNIEAMCELVDAMKQATGRPVVIHIDECHEVAENKRRGDLVQHLDAAGALIVLYTATAVRADAEMIPGFRCEVIGRDDVRRYVVSDAGDEVNNRIDVYEGERRLVQLVADHCTSFKEAWEEKPSPLCNLSREVIDVDLIEIGEASEARPLSACSPTEGRKYLSKAVRHPLVIERAVDMFVSELRTRQRVNPDAAGIIFSCDDLAGERNGHASAIQRVIGNAASDLNCCIVTMKTGEGDDKSTRQIERFVGFDGAGGKGDVLIVKRMGGAGLDSPRIKIVLDLSPVRTVASVIQRLMRVATPWESNRTGSVITLADPLMDAIWSRYITEQGGEPPLMGCDADLELVESYLKEKPDDDRQLPLEITGADVKAFDDNHGLAGDIANLVLVNDMIERFPVLATMHTKPELEQRLRGFGHTYAKIVTKEKSLDERVAAKREEINARVKERAQADADYGIDKDAHIERRRYWMNEAKSAAGISRSVPLDAIKNLSSLDVMLNFLVR